MKTLDLYIAKSIIIGTLMALLVLVSLDVFFGFVAELEDVGQQNYELGHVLIYMFLTLPRRIYDVFQPAVLVGGFLSLGMLASHGELVAMRAAGVSILRIARSTIQAGFILVLFIAVIAEFVVPISEQQAQVFRSEKLGKRFTNHFKNGLWVKTDNKIFHIDKVYPDFRLKHVSIFEFDEDKQLKSSTYIKTAMQENGYWNLRDVKTSKVLNTSEMMSQYYAELNWTELISIDLLNVLSVKPEYMSARDLSNYVDYLQLNKLDGSNYQLAFWLKLVAPLSSIVMLLLALPFVFGLLRSAASGQLLIFGIIVGLVFYILIRVTSYMGQVYGLPPWASATLPIFIFMMMGMLALKRVR